MKNIENKNIRTITIAGSVMQVFTAHKMINPETGEEGYRVKIVENDENDENDESKVICETGFISHENFMDALHVMRD